MRLILDSHEDLRCIDETLAHEILAERLQVPDVPERLGFKLPRFTEQIDAAAPTDYFVYPARAFYAGQPIVFMRRDPRDVVTSMMRLNDGAWFQRWVRAILDEKFKDPVFHERYGRLRDWCERTQAPDAAIGALYWRYKNDAFRLYETRGYPVYLVQYEELVRDAPNALKRVVDFLGVAWQPDRLLSHFTIAHDELMPDGTAIGGTDPSRPIDTSSLGSWTQTLDAAAASIVEYVAYCDLQAL